MSDLGNHDVPPSPQLAEYHDMRKQMCDLADRASQAGLTHIAFALEMAVMLLDEAALPGAKPGPRI